MRRRRRGGPASRLSAALSGRPTGGRVPAGLGFTRGTGGGIGALPLLTCGGTAGWLGFLVGRRWL